MGNHFWSLEPKGETNEKEIIKDLIVESHYKGGIGFLAICNKCGGPSISRCKCVKEKFRKTITDEDIEKYQKDPEEYFSSLKPKNYKICHIWR